MQDWELGHWYFLTATVQVSAKRQRSRFATIRRRLAVRIRLLLVVIALGQALTRDLSQLSVMWAAIWCNATSVTIVVFGRNSTELKC